MFIEKDFRRFQNKRVVATYVPREGADEWRRLMRRAARKAGLSIRTDICPGRGVAFHCDCTDERVRVYAFDPAGTFTIQDMNDD